MVLKRASQRQQRWEKAMFLCSSSILLGAPLRSCWSVRQTKALVVILMQINCIRHTLVFHVPYSHKGTTTLSPGASSALAQGQLRLLPLAPLHCEEGRGAERGSGLGTQPSTLAAKQKQRSLICSTLTGPRVVVQVQPGTSDFITLPNDPTSIKDVHRPTSTSIAGDLSHQLLWWEEHLKRS